MHAKLQRQQANMDARRARVLEAARSVFARAGVDGASIREIAKQAGYTPGAIYSYFDSKEAICVALLAESLERLNAAVAQVRSVRNRPDKTLTARANAWFDLYVANPRDLDLSLYRVAGMKPPDVAPHPEPPLNERLLLALRPCEDAMLELGLSPAIAQRETVALLAHGMGLLLLHHTRRLESFRQSAKVLFNRYLADLLSRCAAPRDHEAAPAEEAGTSAQVDLFS